MVEEFVGTFITIRPVLTTLRLAAKTSRWEVITRPGQESLGIVHWNSGWRCYSFYPDGGTLYEHLCLEEIAGFLKDQTDKQRSTWKKP